MPRSSKRIYLTFDDGPIPEVTPQVLEILATWQAKATFFCVGDNVRKHPAVLEMIKEQGHSLGNHTYHHLNGFSTLADDYLQNVLLCDEVLQISPIGHEKKLFRPPYGRISTQQRKILQEQYRVVMWDVLSADFDLNLSPQRCLQKSICYTRPGSIVVFHDSLKAWHRLQWVLPRFLKHFSRKGFTFESL